MSELPDDDFCEICGWGSCDGKCPIQDIIDIERSRAYDLMFGGGGWPGWPQPPGGPPKPPDDPPFDEKRAEAHRVLNAWKRERNNQSEVIDWIIEEMGWRKKYGCE